MGKRAVGLVAGLMVVLPLSACQGKQLSLADDPAASAGRSGSGAPQDPGATPQATGSKKVATDRGGGSSTSNRSKPSTGELPVADPEHAVDPPGPRRSNEAIAPPDMLIYNADEPLSDDLVQQVAALDGVEEVATMSMAQVSFENRVYTVGAVDSASYRLFTESASALFEDQWNRVAGGEVSISPEADKQLPIDGDGFVNLTVGDTSQKIHVGAIAPQIDGVDAVVNTAWGADLGIPAGNALLLRTGQTSPQALRPQITKIVGDQATIQDMDVVAREGLDPGATQTAFTVGGASEAIGTFRYTVLTGGRIAPESSWVSSHIVTTEVPILGSVTCNRYIIPQLTAALSEIATRGLADEIHPGEYAGCYYPRFIAGTTSLSNHSFGTALDLNTPGNQRGTVGEIDRDVVSIFKKWGFAWGGDWSYTDPMHFEANQIVDPR